MCETYEDSWPVVVTRAEIVREFATHSMEWSEFVAVHGEHEGYKSAVVLRWMGY